MSGTFPLPRHNQYSIEQCGINWPDEAGYVELKYLFDYEAD
jgi:hypothetical protein